ncbi:hypothetical protein KTR66_01125 [Roseococcus sp. SDR]|uniref:SMP-30/gluconolactonase/LRE family protein n=1 Tax=Roseococcus sp. SDR TaxID=2835532 RepID=UPI001BCD6863|nr:hypothetical protein [Roseococcus sp. SDR]MBS7788573.1 hypothetical protein [Roseococcus sp. SDR]MBV1843887.1 hypothetical protein [Roseococcus sp. SDR]
MIIPRRAALALPPGLALTSLAQAQQPAHRVVALYPSGHFLENLMLRPDGAVLFTSYFAREVGIWSEAAGQAVFARIEGHPVSLAHGTEGPVLALHGVPFTEGARLAGSGAVLQLSRDGRPGRRIPLPEAGFLNGMARLSDNIYLIADSGLGRIWRLDLTAGTATPWLAVPDMAPDPGRPGLPGVNGLQIAGNALYFSNSARPGIWRVMLGTDGAPAGAAQRVATLPGVDDFVVLPSGGFLAATHGDVVLRVAANGAVTPLIETPDIAGCTAVALAPRPGGGLLLYISASGGLLERRGLPAHLVRVELPNGL